jgi:hypothetical protein
MTSFSPIEFGYTPLTVQGGKLWRAAEAKRFFVALGWVRARGSVGASRSLLYRSFADRAASLVYAGPALAPSCCRASLAGRGRSRAAFPAPGRTGAVLYQGLAGRRGLVIFPQYLVFVDHDVSASSKDRGTYVWHLWHCGL